MLFRPIMVHRLVPALALIGLAVCLSPGAGRAQTLTIGADVWCPMNCEPGTERPGYMVEIARAVFEPVGIEVVYEVMPWARAVEASRVGLLDGVIGALREEAPDFLFPDRPLGVAQGAFLVRADDPWRFEGYESLAGRVVGTVLDYGYGEEFEALVEDGRVIAEPAAGDYPLESNFRKLEAGRIDVVIDSLPVLLAELQRTGMNDGRFVMAGKDTPNWMHIAFSPANPDSERYARMLAVGVERLSRSGALGSILDRYGLEDWITEFEAAVVQPGFQD